MPRGNVDIHAQATDLLIKALQASGDQRIRFIEEVLAATTDDLTRRDHKKIQEYARKVCALRDQLAIQLYDIELIDPRQLVMGLDDIRPKDFE